MAVHYFGIRHHGPGSSKHLLEALEELKPDIILIEGPPEGEAILSWISHKDMVPPVALLTYVPDQPQNAVFYPFAEFSPEWNAVKTAHRLNIPVRLIDMPLAHKFGLIATKNNEENFNFQSNPENPADGDIRETIDLLDPISYLAEIDGFLDSEEWWEHQFEITPQPLKVFEAITNAMCALREVFPDKKPETQVREAFMRKALRTAQKEMYTEIAVICGAWHIPAIKEMPKQKDDDLLIKNLPKAKVECTWIPWTFDRLSFESGYGAGITSPGWYNHIWKYPNDDGTRWLSYTANVFRKNKIDVSSAHIIEAVRLTHALTALRGMVRPGLKELNEATQTVMCMGESILLELVKNELIVGYSIGQVPEGTPQIPLHRDFEKQIKSLRLKIDSEHKIITLDLRENHDLQKSILLHRLNLLEINWGKTQHIYGKGTFKEEWSLKWTPEMIIMLLEKAPWGNEIETAANNYLIHISDKCNQLSEITKIAQNAIPAELNIGIVAIMNKMDELAATTTDTSDLMETFTPLVSIKRYGNVRNTDINTISIIISSIFYRIIANLPVSCSNINEDEALELSKRIKKVHNAVALLNDSELAEAWKEVLFKIVGINLVEPIIHGTCCKLLYDIQVIDDSTTASMFSLALSTGNDPNYSANWLEGFLDAAAAILILDDKIWNIVNNWVSNLQPEVFINILPLLRRTFATFNSIEKQKIGTRAKRGILEPIDTNITIQEQLQLERAFKVLPVMADLLGIK